MKYFYKGIMIEVPESVYYPREDTELLAKAIEKQDVKNKKCLETCCGSGILSIIMAKKGAYITSVDINPEAVKTTKENAKTNGVNVNTIQTDMFDKRKIRFDYFQSALPA